MHSLLKIVSQYYRVFSFLFRELSELAGQLTELYNVKLGGDILELRDDPLF